MKRIISLLLATIMTMSVFSTSVYATEEHENLEGLQCENVTDEVMEKDAASGTMMSNAVELKFGDTYFKSWAADTDHLNHYVKFTLSKRGVITVKATKPFDDEGEYGRIKFTIYDKDGEAIMGNDSYNALDNAKDSYEFKCGLAAGTYYMTMKPGFYVRTGLIETYYSVSFKATDSYEVEANGDATQATFMSYNKMYTGHFGSDGNDFEENDYFKYPTISGHDYKITFKNFGNLDRTSTIIDLIQPHESVSLKYRIRDKIDMQGLNYYEYNAPYDWFDYINLYNYSQSQYEYGIQVTDLTIKYGTHKVTKKVTQPTCTKEGYTTYKCSCGGSFDSDYVEATGKHEYTNTVVKPTCVKKGYTIYTCKSCKYTYKGNYVNASGVHTYDGITCVDCGYTYEGEVSTYRIAGENRCETSMKVADVTKEKYGFEKFNTLIIANSKNFADALAGSYLAKVKSAPIILSNGKNDLDILSYAQDNLADDGEVYILGGTSAVSKSLEFILSDYNVKRLEGTSRLGTNIAILQEAGVTNEEIIVATALKFADSLSASATGRPIFLVNNEKGVLTEDQKAYLETLETERFYIVGGTSAVSDELAAEIENYGEVIRLGGATRYETSVLIARMFFKKPEAAVLAWAQNFPDGLSGGALATSMNAPLILVSTNKEQLAADYINGNTNAGYVLGGPQLISDKAVKNVFTLDGNAPIPLL